ncbi:hypothetical protein [Hymenobacter sediminicola]|uniref:Uncharacterized protein n=1 Tax=Hymenobacter sediminicola TaxID=2761579 RepID=A0A7G7W4U1_9BACT|nr:hypothetical protein [Hymenobacter sediminicola]QNH61384.1 hypothetical protein H4317_14620 [Hymenobacter sediminicola]
MLDVTATAEPILDIWPYVESVASDDLEGYQLTDGIVRHVYQDPKDRFLHVLVSTDDINVFLVVIINLKSIKVHGHYLLDLPKLYDLQSEPEE